MLGVVAGGEGGGGGRTYAIHPDEVGEEGGGVEGVVGEAGGDVCVEGKGEVVVEGEDGVEG